VCELQQQTCSQTDYNANKKASEEVQQKYADALKQSQQCEASSIFAGFVLLRRLKQHNGNGVV
jgi:hypothetical protein